MIYNNKFSIVLFIFLIGFIYPACAQNISKLENDLYSISLQSQGSVQITLKKTSEMKIFKPDFTVLFRNDRPVVKTPVDKKIGYRANVWNVPPSKVWSANYLEAGSSTLLKASGAIIKQNKLIWEFPSHQQFDLIAELSLPAGIGEPKIKFELKAKKDGWYSVGYTGAPEIKESQLYELWQPFI